MKEVKKQSWVVQVRIIINYRLRLLTQGPRLGWVLETLSCVGDCGITALILGLKTVFFALLPLITLFSTLALPFLGLPDGKLAVVGLVALVLYELVFLVTFGVF
jgi:hypothetical protein